MENYQSENELAKLKEAIEDLQKRVAKLEVQHADKAIQHKNEILQARCVQPATQEHKVTSTTDTAEPLLASQETLVLEPPELADSQAKNLSTAREKLPVVEQSLETKIGLYWLNRIGIVSLVLGLVFLLLYSFQYFGPLAKVFTGYASAGFLIYFAHKLWKRQEMHWYAQGIEGGGWALAYFVTYAIGHVASVQLISNEIIELILLISVAYGALWQALQRNSETMAILANVLAFVSIIISGISSASLFATFILVASLAYCVFKKQWFGLYAVMAVCSYGAIDIAQQRFQVPWNISLYSPELLPVAAIYILVFLTLILLPLKIAPQVAVQRRLMIWGSIINGIAFVTSFSQFLTAVHISNSAWCPIAVGLIYLLLTPFAPSKSPIATVTLLLGLSFFNIGLWDILEGPSLRVFSAIEILLLTHLGLRYAIPAMRNFAAFLAIVAFLAALVDIDTFSTRLPFGFPRTAAIDVILAISFLACAYRYSKLLPKLTESRVPRDFTIPYFLGAIMLLWLVPAGALYGSARLLCWALEASAIGWLGFKLKRKFIRVSAVAMTLLWTFYLPLTDERISAALLSILLAFLVVKMRFVTLRSQELSRNERDLLYYCLLIAAVVVNLVLTSTLPTEWLSAACALEGVLLVVLGFLWQEKVLRFWALFIFGCLAVKLLFVDLANADTIQRIVSFIIAGLALLGCSYGYGLYVKQQSKPSPDKASD